MYTFNICMDTLGNCEASITEVHTESVGGMTAHVEGEIWGGFIKLQEVPAVILTMVELLAQESLP